MKTISIHSILIFTIAQQSLANYVVGPRLLAMLHGRPPLGDQLYYKSSEGALHGPFPKNQVLSWWQQGYFPRGVPLASSPNGPFFAIENIVEQAMHDSPVPQDNTVKGDMDDHRADSALPDASTSPRRGNFKLSTLKVTTSTVLKKLHDGAWKQRERKAVNPLVQFYARPGDHSFLEATWQPFIASAAVRAAVDILAIRTMVLLLGLFTGEYIDSTLTLGIASKPNISPMSDNPMLGLLLDTRKGWSRAVASATVGLFLQSVYGKVFTSVALWGILSVVLAPLLWDSILKSSMMWHFNEQASNPVLKSMRSKFDFTVEASSSVALIRSVYTLLLLTIVATIASLVLRSPVYGVVAVCVAWQAMCLVQLPSIKKERIYEQGIARHNSNDDAHLASKFRRQVEDLEDVAVFDEDGTVKRWPKLLDDLTLARQRAMFNFMTVSRNLNRDPSMGKAFTASTIVQVFILGSVLVNEYRTAALRDISANPAVAYIQKYLGHVFMSAFTGVDMTRISAANAATLISIGKRMSSISILLVLPVIIWSEACTRSTLGAKHLRTLEHLWSDRAITLPWGNAEKHATISAEITRSSDGNDRWATDGPDKASGIVLEHVTTVGAGHVRLRDITTRIPCGKLTVLIGPRSGEAEINYLLELLWSGHDGDATEEAMSIQKGSVEIHGRDIRDWKLSTLREKITFMKDREALLPMNLGNLCGLGMENTMEGLDRQRMAVALSGVGDVEKLFGSGFKTDLGLAAKSSLTADQWRKIYLCRALCQWNRDIVILQSPTQHMSELEEKRFLEKVKTIIRPDQVVLVSSTRHATARYADQALLYEKGLGVRSLDSGQKQATF